MQAALKMIGNLKLHIRKDAVEIRDFFANDISRKLKEYRDVEHRDVLFLSSGGSALDVLDYIEQEVFGPYLTIGIFDERYDPTHRTSNYAALRKTKFFRHAVAHGCRLIDTVTQKDQSQVELADFYEQELRTWRKLHPQGAIMATMGVATDGHTMGILPFAEDPEYFRELFDSDRWVTSYDATGKSPFPKRITTTFSFLRSVDSIGIFIVGAQKGEMFKKLLAGDNVAEMPGRIIKSLTRGSLYADRALMQSAGMME